MPHWCPHCASLVPSLTFSGKYWRFLENTDISGKLPHFWKITTFLENYHFSVNFWKMPKMPKNKGNSGVEGARTRTTGGYTNRPTAPYTITPGTTTTVPCSAVLPRWLHAVHRCVWEGLRGSPGFFPLQSGTQHTFSSKTVNFWHSEKDPVKTAKIRQNTRKDARLRLGATKTDESGGFDEKVVFLLLFWLPLFYPCFTRFSGCQVSPCLLLNSGKFMLILGQNWEIHCFSKTWAHWIRGSRTEKTTEFSKFLTF